MKKYLFFLLLLLFQGLAYAIPEGTNCPAKPIESRYSGSACSFVNDPYVISNELSTGAVCNLYTLDLKSSWVGKVTFSPSTATYCLATLNTGGTLGGCGVIKTNSCPAGYTSSGSQCLPTSSAQCCESPNYRNEVSGVCLAPPSCDLSGNHIEVNPATGNQECKPYPPTICADVHADLTNPMPGASTHCDFHLEATPPNECPAQSVIDSLNNCHIITCLGPHAYQQFGTSLSFCSEPPTVCGLHEHHPDGDNYSCVADPPADCAALGAHMINDPADPYNCISEPPTECPAGTHHTGDQWSDCVADETPPPPPPDGGGDGGGDPPPDGGGDPPPDDGSGGSGDGTGNGTCGSLACEKTMGEISGKLTDLLRDFGSTRANEFAAMVETARKTDLKTSLIHAVAEQAMEYAIDTAVEMAKNTAANTELLAKTQSVLDEIKTLAGKHDVLSQKMDTQLEKFTELNGKMDLTKSSIDQVGQKIDLTKETLANKLDITKDTLGNKLDLTKEAIDKLKLDTEKLSWLEKLSKLDLLGDIIGSLFDIKDFFSSMPDNLASLPDKIQQLPDKIALKLDFCKDHPDWLFCPEEPPEIEPEQLQTQELDVNVEKLAGSAGQCPAPLYWYSSLVNRSYSISFEYFCELASSIRMLVIAFAYLTAARILAGAMNG